MLRLSSVRALAFVCALSCGGSAFAQPNTTPSNDEIVAARESFRLGEKNLAAGNFQAALADFRKADAAVNKPTTRIGVARALVGLGRLVEAREVARTVNEIPAPADEHERLVRARDEAAALAKKLDGRVARIRVILAPAGTEAAVFLDDEPLTLANQAGLDVDPGRHTLRATPAGGESVEQSVELAEGESRDVALQLGGSANPGDASDDGGGLVAGPVTWTGITMAGVGLIAGAVAGGLTLSRASDIETICTAGDGNDCLAPEDDERDAALLSAHVSTGGFVLAGVGAGVALIGLLAVDHPADASDEVALSPILGPGFVGLRGLF